MLNKNGFDAGKYVSFEEQINNYKGFYYEALKQSSDGWDNNENDYSYFVEYYLGIILNAYKEFKIKSEYFLLTGIISERRSSSGA